MPSERLNIQDVALPSGLPRPRTPDGAPQAQAKVRHYAQITRQQVSQLARAMPDTQSAILLCLGWEALRQERLMYGPCAGTRLARFSSEELGELTGHRADCVRRALGKLRERGLIRKLSGDGCKGLHEVLSLQRASEG